jgi:ribosomal protein L11 methyltransferase
VKDYPALDVRTDAPDMLAALVDDFFPTAIEPRNDHVRVFFARGCDRDAAARALTRYDVSPVEVSDGDWALRSQQNLQPITVGRVTVVPSSRFQVASQSGSQVASRKSLTIVIVPSMGFGTGHHATTRMCLAALQTIDLGRRDLLDVGTGSGILAIASDRLGAARVTGIDCDADAIQSARENLALNPDARHVTFEVADLAATRLPPADVITANLTGALLVGSAAAIARALRPDGTLILSGLLAHERDEVYRAFGEPGVEWEREEGGWLALAVKRS